eukprot:3709942-Ditylum_brightwellii.AAC.1
MAYAAKQQKNKTYTFNGIMKHPDQKEFVLSMLNEVKVHKDREHWTLMKKDDVLICKRANGKVKTIISIWSFKRK